jgi:hypothetical protein
MYEVGFQHVSLLCCPIQDVWFWEGLQKIRSNSTCYFSALTVSCLVLESYHLAEEQLGCSDAYSAQFNQYESLKYISCSI